MTDAELASSLRIAVMRLRRRLANEHDPAHDLSMAAMSVLAALHRFGEMTLGDLAERERVRPPSMTRAIQRLVEPATWLVPRERIAVRYW